MVIVLPFAWPFFLFPSQQAPITPAPICGPVDVDSNRIVGYWQGRRHLTPAQISGLTHVIFAFIPMYQNGSIIVGDWHRQRLEWLKQAKMANARLKSMIAIGGAENSQYFPTVVADSNSRELFTTSIMNVVKTYELDGVDIDWEFPKNDADKANYGQLMQRICLGLRELQTTANRPSRYVLSFASGYDKWSLGRGYNLNSLIQTVDFINVMTYDYYGAWEAPSGCLTGPPAPLFGGTWMTQENADSTMRHYACTTRNVKKLNMGVPFYGRYWKIVGDAFFFDPLFRNAYPSRAGGFCEGNAVAFRDIPGSWHMEKTTFHYGSRVPYIHENSSYLGYENPESIGYKVDYAIANNIGGLMIWAIDQDDDHDSLIKATSSRSGLLRNNNVLAYNC